MLLFFWFIVVVFVFDVFVFVVVLANSLFFFFAIIIEDYEGGLLLVWKEIHDNDPTFKHFIWKINLINHVEPFFIFQTLLR